MFCPECGSEYMPEFTRCQECDVDLVPDPPQLVGSEVKNIEYQEILSTFTPSDVAIIKSLLDAEGITYFFQGETVAPYLYNVVPMRLLVEKDEVEAATEILKDLQLSLIYGRPYKEEQDEDA